MNNGGSVDVIYLDFCKGLWQGATSEAASEDGGVWRFGYRLLAWKNGWLLNRWQRVWMRSVGKGGEGWWVGYFWDRCWDLCCSWCLWIDWIEIEIETGTCNAPLKQSPQRRSAAVHFVLNKCVFSNFLKTGNFKLPSLRPIGRLFPATGPATEKPQLRL